MHPEKYVNLKAELYWGLRIALPVRRHLWMLQRKEPSGNSRAFATSTMLAAKW